MKIVEERMFDLSKSLTTRVEAQKIRNPRLSHMNIVDSLEYPPLELSSGRLLQRNKPRDWTSALSSPITMNIDKAVLAEYVERHPLLLNRPGMSARLIDSIGYNKCVLPLGGENFEEGMVLQTNLAVAPAHLAHTRRGPRLLLVVDIVDMGNRRVKRAMLHVVHDVVLVGQQQPCPPAFHNEVSVIPGPKTFSFKDLLSRRVYFHVHNRLFSKQNKMINVSEELKDWPPELLSYAKDALFKLTSGCKKQRQVRDGKRMSPQQLAVFLTPEECVKLDASLMAKQRLVHLGIKRTTHPRDIVKQLCATAQGIHEELERVPWVLSHNFQMFLDGNCRLQICSADDPIGGGCGFSFKRCGRNDDMDDRIREDIWERQLCLISRACEHYCAEQTTPGPSEEDTALFDSLVQAMENREAPEVCNNGTNKESDCWGYWKTKNRREEFLKQVTWKRTSTSEKFQKVVTEFRDPIIVSAYKKRLRIPSSRSDSPDYEKQAASRLRNKEKIENFHSSGIFRFPNTSGSSVKCSACGLWGHVKSSAQCPSTCVL
jgi:hypothetical protein